ncbi:hypothetical protein [Crassaminicella profunda]|uniref:hypothetical protein n=1 Tax=Crassaminicella profunda TaxID=1286698 RepID=UPI001CA70A6B|nr:hypothetical protein [Crassaminicella profunda]QZY55739.1 hypothetical protein K7H06_01605 [Crassaminicella profunda]
MKKIWVGIFIVMIIWVGGSHKNQIQSMNEEKEKNITDYFMVLEIPYDPVCDGLLTQAEKEELLAKRILQPKDEFYSAVTLEIIELSDEKIEIRGEVQIEGEICSTHLYTVQLVHEKNHVPMVVEEISFAQQNWLSLYRFELEKNELKIIGSSMLGEDVGLGILPKITVNDFLEKKDQMISTYDGCRILYGLNEDGTIWVEPDTWMNKDFENKKIKYDIHLKWNGKKFKMIKKENKDL